MRTVTLPDSGRQIILGVTHKVKDVILGNNFKITVRCRTTHVHMTDLSNGVEIEVCSVCSPNDNFCRREGRRQAAMKLLRRMKLSKADKEAIFKSICPEFNNNIWGVADAFSMFINGTDENGDELVKQAFEAGTRLGLTAVNNPVVCKRLKQELRDVEKARKTT